MFANLDAANRARDKVRTSLRERARRGGMGLGRRARDPLPAGVRNAQVTLWQPECRVRVPSHGASRVWGASDLVGRLVCRCRGAMTSRARVSRRVAIASPGGTD